MSKQTKIEGILCDLATDENEFYNVYIAEGQPLLPEWLIRQAVDYQTAIASAKVAIRHRKRGDVIIHSHPEGIIQVIREERLADGKLVLLRIEQLLGNEGESSC